MDALRTGIMTLFNAGGDFYNDIPGRLFFGEAPDGTNLSEGPYCTYFFVTTDPDDVFAKEEREAYVQFSLYSGASSPATILAMAEHLETMLKDKSFTVTGWTVINSFLQQTNGPMIIPEDTEAGTGKYWQTDIDYLIMLSKA